MQIDMMQTARLVPYIRNARTHSADQVAQIAASIAEFGFTNPILIGEDDVIIAGHGRLLAAQSLGLTEVPVIVLDHLSEAQRRALILADNRIAENAGWDNAMLASELAALRDENFDLEMIGFDEAELEELLAGLEFGDAGALGGDGQGGGAAEGDAQPAASSSGSLAARFGIPPFSILDARKGWCPPLALPDSVTDRGCGRGASGLLQILLFVREGLRQTYSLASDAKKLS